MIPNFTAVFSSVVGASIALKASQEQRCANDAADPTMIDVEAGEIEEPRALSAPAAARP